MPFRLMPVLLVAVCALAGVLGGTLARPATAHEYTLGDLEIVHPWGRDTEGAAKRGAAYLDIINHGGSPDRLIAASSPASASVELHEHVSENGILHMKAVEAIDIKPGEHVVLQPGSFHIMLLDLVAPLVEGESIPLTLTFERAGSIEVSVLVASVATMHSPHGAGETDP